MVGKIDAADLLAGDAFFGGYGIQRFHNVAFAVPVSGVLPPVFFGAITSLRTPSVTWTAMVYDPEDRTTDYWPDRLFASGTVVALGGTHTGKRAGRTTVLSLTGTWSNKDGADLGQLLLPEDLRTDDKGGS